MLSAGTESDLSLTGGDCSRAVLRAPSVPCLSPGLHGAAFQKCKFSVLGPSGVCLAHPVWHRRLQSRKNPQICIYRLSTPCWWVPSTHLGAVSHYSAVSAPQVVQEPEQF